MNFRQTTQIVRIAPDGLIKSEIEVERETLLIHFSRSLSKLASIDIVESCVSTEPSCTNLQVSSGCHYFIDIILYQVKR